MVTFNDLTKILYNQYIGALSNIIDKLSTKDIDDIITLSYNKADTQFIINHATIFSVPYSNSKGYIDIICLEGQLFKMLNKDKNLEVSDTRDDAQRTES